MNSITIKARRGDRGQLVGADESSQWNLEALFGDNSDSLYVSPGPGTAAFRRDLKREGFTLQVVRS